MLTEQQSLYLYFLDFRPSFWQFMDSTEKNCLSPEERFVLLGTSGNLMEDNSMNRHYAVKFPI